MQAVGGVDAMIDSDCKDKDLLALVTYISADERAEKVMKNQSVIRQPIVRNGRQATVGYAPDVWKTVTGSNEINQNGIGYIALL